MITLGTYVVYLAVSIAVTVWVAKTLHANGRAFLNDAFQNSPELAASVNHLLVVGFYLVNLGYVCYVLKMNIHPTTLATAIEMLSQKLGIVLLVLGGMHFANIAIFSAYRKKAMVHFVNPPVAPQTTIKKG